MIEVPSRSQQFVLVRQKKTRLMRVFFGRLEKESTKTATDFGLLWITERAMEFSCALAPVYFFLCMVIDASNWTGAIRTPTWCSCAHLHPYRWPKRNALRILEVKYGCVHDDLASKVFRSKRLCAKDSS